jgi:ribosomal protein S18 acetylase RimI-like enzyme
MLADSPWAFAASPSDDSALDPGELARVLADEHEAIFAIAGLEDAERDPALGDPEAGACLVAAVGIVLVTTPKSRHRARIWGAFVDPAHRGRGLGRRVVTAAIARGREWAGVDFLDLAVSGNSPEAQRLYESLGFVAWGREPEAIEWAGQRHDEIYMTLRI